MFHVGVPQTNCEHMTPIISIYPGESVEHNWASTGERAWCWCWDSEEEGMLFLISFADCLPDSSWHWITGAPVQQGGVCVCGCERESQRGGVFLWAYNRVGAERHGIHLKSLRKAGGTMRSVGNRHTGFCVWGWTHTSARLHSHVCSLQATGD